MTRSGGVSSWKEKDEACSNKVMHWTKLHRLLTEVIYWTVFVSRFIYLKKQIGKPGGKKQTNIGGFKTGERFNPQNTHTQTQTHRQGLGRRSNGPELSPFRLRTSEVPLCAALHLFYPSSLIRPRWPHDPGARVTCQLTVYSWARGLTLCQHLFCEKGRRKKRGVWVQCGEDQSNKQKS